MGREVHKGGDICKPKADSCLCMAKKPIQHCKAVILQLKKNNFMLGLPWHPVVKNSPANAGYTGLIPGLGTTILHASEQLSLCSRAHALQREGTSMRSLHTTARVTPTCHNQRRPVHGNNVPGLCNKGQCSQ